MRAMDAETLRARQAPLKERYRHEPAAAMLTLTARGRVDPAALTFTLESGKPGVPAGLHPATGGDGTAACSGDMLLEALVACAGVTLAAVATAMGVAMRAATVSAAGELDFRGTLGVAKDAPVGFQRIAIVFAIETDAPDEKVTKLVELTERYCVVLASLRHAAAITTTVERSA
jgi:uncharacterized OsmC-like protein